MVGDVVAALLLASLSAYFLLTRRSQLEAQRRLTPRTPPRFSRFQVEVLGVGLSACFGAVGVAILFSGLAGESVPLAAVAGAALTAALVAAWRVGAPDDDSK